jgi:hypothetical protein
MSAAQISLTGIYGTSGRATPGLVIIGGKEVRVHQAGTTSTISSVGKLSVVSACMKRFFRCRRECVNLDKVEFRVRRIWRRGPGSNQRIKVSILNRVLGERHYTPFYFSNDT